MKADRPTRGGAAAALCLLLSCAAGADPAAEPAPALSSVPVQPGRPDASRTAEPYALSQLQQQLDALPGPQAGCEQAYAANKAQAWINFGKYAAAEQLPRDVQAAALGNSSALLEALAYHRVFSHATPELPGARHMRDDLWQGIAAVEKDGRLCAAPKMTAYCEVQLAWVDYEAAAGGWRHADPYVRIAEDYCSSALNAAPVPQRAPPVAAQPAAASAAAPPPVSEPDVSVVFPHNRSRRGDIRRSGHAQLKQLATRWSSGLHLGTIHIVGHADLTGHTGYNLRLSDRRAQSVARELQLLGVPLEAMYLEAVGSSQDVVQCSRPIEAAERRRYLACLEPNRRVVVHIGNP